MLSSTDDLEANCHQFTKAFPFSTAFGPQSLKAGLKNANDRNPHEQVSLHGNTVVCHVS